MIEKLLQIAQLGQKGEIKRLTHFNTTLPILLEVLKKTKHQHYLLKIGNQILETKSLKELEIGGRYFALMRHLNHGGIMLSLLKKEPEIPKNFLEISLGEFKKERLEKSQNFQEMAFEKMLHSQNKDEFLSWGFFLLGLQKGIMSFWFEHEQKRVFLQTKAKKSQIDFYALFPHLGEIEGRIFALADSLVLELNVAYEGVAQLLEKNQSLLKGVSELRVQVSDKITPLFLPKEQLLDLKI